MRTFKLFLSTYFTCGVIYCAYTAYKLLEAKDRFLMMFHSQFGEDTKLEYFILFLMLSSFLFWPLMIIGETSKKDLE